MERTSLFVQIGKTRQRESKYIASGKPGFRCLRDPPRLVGYPERGAELGGEKVHQREHNVLNNKFSNFMACLWLAMMVIAQREKGRIK